MAAVENDKKMITTKSSDGEEFEAATVAAMRSRAIRGTIEDNCADNGIPLPRVSSKILSKVIEYCNKHGAAKASNTSGDAASPAVPAPSGGGLGKWDADLISVDQATLFDLALPAQRSAFNITGDDAMANQAAAPPPMPVPGLLHHRNIAAANRPPPAAAQLLINCGLFLVCTAGSFILFPTAGDPSAMDNPAYALVAFLFVVYALLAPVANQFPGATRVAVAIAKALKGYLLGGGN